MANESAEQRRLAAIMFTDMVGYSALAQRNEALALDLLAEQKRLLQPVFAQHNAREIKSTGDGFLVEHASALQAVRCAVAIQKALVEHNASTLPDRRIEVRIGLHIGDVVERDGDVFGDGVNIAARIEPLAEPSGICVSRAVFEQIQSKIDVALVPIGQPRLKNIETPIEVYRVVLPWEGGSVPLRPRTPTLVQGRGRALVAGAALLAALIAIGFWLRTPPHASQISEPSEAKKSIAVLPFVNMSPDSSDQYLADGVTEEIITTLSKIAGLRVAARTSSFTFKGKNDDIEKIGQQLRVGTVLEGSVSKAGNKLRITAQLINVADGYHLWSEDYDRQMQDIFAIRSDVAQRVGDALRIQLGVSGRQQIAKNPTDNLQAYQLYLKGNFETDTGTKDGQLKAIDYFQQAIAIDPNYALAYVGLSFVYQVLDDWYAPPREVMPKAREAAAKALALDDSLGEAHIQMATVHFWYDWDWPAAEQEYRRGLELNPSYALGHTLYGWYLLVAMDRPEDGIAEAERALELDPLSAGANGVLGQTLNWARRYDEAIQHLRAWIAFEPNDWYSHRALGLAYQQTGNLSAAIAEFERATQLEPSNHEALAALVRGYALAGRRDDAQKGLDELLARSQREQVPAYNVAVAYAALGDNDRAFEWLEKSYDDRSFYPVQLKVDPDVDSLRSDPRFAELLKRVGFDK
jgi:TolB-like protein/class 3 adenylate cyclase/tetratricopeptide (TPR) repeat protein